MKSACRRRFSPVLSLVRFIFPYTQVLLLLTPSWVCAQPKGEEIGPDAFLVKYRQVLRESPSAYRDVQIEGEAWERVPIRESKDLPVQFVERNSSFFSYTSSDGSEELHFRVEKPDFAERAFVLTDDKHGFSVRRLKPEGPFSLQRLFDPVDVKELMDAYRSVKKAPYCPPLCPTFPDFPAWVNSSQFKVTQVSLVTEGDKSVLKVLFDYRPEGAQQALAEGWFCVDPSIGWVLRSFDIETRVYGKNRQNQAIVTLFRHTGSVSYTQDNDRPVPAEIQYGYALNNKATNTFRYSYKLSAFHLASTNSSRFTLDAFGLGDYRRTLGQVETRATYRSAAIVIAALLTSLVLFWFGRKFHSRWKGIKARNRLDHTGGSRAS